MSLSEHGYDLLQHGCDPSEDGQDPSLHGCDPSVYGYDSFGDGYTSDDSYNPSEYAHTFSKDTFKRLIKSIQGWL